ncbi:TIGR04222 domain-containing membrane protein [Streptomyces sp. NPDC004609]|uniref:TIGR04222 domain-containing membrane protein n=1 Tax=Streptomyces sp. NPDC004609 TaxID=3364704 RepID=UPI00369AD74D
MLWVVLLLLAWAVAGIACARVCVAAVTAARRPAREPADGHADGPASDRADGGADDRADGPLTLYEAAFLSGGPGRVTDLVLVSMHRRRGLLLAHTGWATLVAPEGTDALERSVVRSIGPAGHQAPIAVVRTAVSSAGALRAVADGLVRAGLAVPETTRTRTSAALRAVRAAAVLVAVLAVAAVTLPEGPPARGTALAWFALPLLLTLSCLAIARVEVRPYTRWASPEGRRLLGALAPAPDGTAHGELTAFALRGPDAVGDPLLREALTGGRRERAGGRTAHRGY